MDSSRQVELLQKENAALKRLLKDSGVDILSGSTSCGTSSTDSSCPPVPLLDGPHDDINAVKACLPELADDPAELQLHFAQARDLKIGQFGQVLFLGPRVLKLAKNGPFGDTSPTLAAEAHRASLALHRTAGLRGGDELTRLGRARTAWPIGWKLLDGGLLIEWAPKVEGGVPLPFFVQEKYSAGIGIQADRVGTIVTDVASVIQVLNASLLCPWDMHASDLLICDCGDGQIRAMLVDAWARPGSMCVQSYLPPQYRNGRKPVDETSNNDRDELSRFVMGVYCFVLWSAANLIHGTTERWCFAAELARGFLTADGEAASTYQRAAGDRMSFLGGIAECLIEPMQPGLVGDDEILPISFQEFVAILQDTDFELQPHVVQALRGRDGPQFSCKPPPDCFGDPLLEGIQVTPWGGPAPVQLVHAAAAVAAPGLVGAPVASGELPEEEDAALAGPRGI
jgi:hypothetical protein